MKKPLKKLVIAATGSVAAAYLPQFITMARIELAEEVHLILSESAQKFLNVYTAKLYTENRVIDDAFEITDDFLVPHIQVSQDADVMLVLPSTANILSKAAAGIADEVVSLSILSANCPVVFVPSMNEIMWFKKVIQENVKRLQNHGHFVMNPVKGLEISTMKATYGCMPSFREIFEFVKKVPSQKQKLRSKRHFKD